MWASCKTSRKLRGFLLKKEAGVRFERGPFPLRRNILMLCSLQSQRLYCFRHRGCWDRWPFGPYFTSLLATFIAVKDKACASYRWVILVRYIVAGSMVMSYMKELPIVADNYFKAIEKHVESTVFVPERFGRCVDCHMALKFSWMTLNEKL